MTATLERGWSVSGSFDRQFGRLNLRNRVMFGDCDRFYQSVRAGRS